jgi:hypothetical protein
MILPLSIDQLRADDWRAKKEGLDAVAECLKRANHRIAANVGDLCAALKPSLINNNKALVLAALALTATLAADLGPAGCKAQACVAGVRCRQGSS